LLARIEQRTGVLRQGERNELFLAPTTGLFFEHGDPNIRFARYGNHLNDQQPIPGLIHSRNSIVRLGIRQSCRTWLRI
jgi:hypothetical protein